MDGRKLPENLRNAFKEGWICLIGTSSIKGIPHIAIADRIRFGDDGKISIEIWGCPHTLDNISENKKGLLIFLDPSTSTGFQLTGNLLISEERAILNGYT